MLTSHSIIVSIPETACPTRREYDSVPSGNRRTGAGMEWSLGSFGDARLDKGGVRSSNGWSRAKRSACAGWVVTVEANCKQAGSSPTRRLAPAKAGVTAAKIVEGWSRLTGAAVAGRHVLAIQACPCGGARA